jgi:hypothetical protein
LRGIQEIKILLPTPVRAGLPSNFASSKDFW